MHKTPHDQGCYQVPPNSINSCFGGTEQPLDLQWGGGAIHHPWEKKEKDLWSLMQDTQLEASRHWCLPSQPSLQPQPPPFIFIVWSHSACQERIRKAFEKMCCDLSSRKNMLAEFPQVQYGSQVWALRFSLVCQFRSYTRPLALPEDTMIIQYQGLPSFCKYVQISKYIYIH